MHRIPAYVTPAEGAAYLCSVHLAANSADAEAIVTDAVRTDAVKAIFINDGGGIPDQETVALGHIDFQYGTLSREPFGCDADDENAQSVVNDPAGGPWDFTITLRVRPPCWRVLLQRDLLVAYAKAQRDLAAATRRLVTRPRGPWREAAALELAAVLFGRGFPERRGALGRHLADALARQGLTPDIRTIERWLAEELPKVERRATELAGDGF